MARARNIKPGFFLNDELAEIDPLGRLLFAGIWTIADRDGRLEDRPKKIKAEVLPYDDCDVDRLLQTLHDKGFIIRYQANDKSYIAVTNWHKHQNPHIKEAASEIPAPDLHHTSTIQAPEKNSTSPADSLNLIPDSLNLLNNNDDDHVCTPEELNNQTDAKNINLYTVFENEFGRPLSPIESEQIKKWEAEHSVELVLEALKRAVLRGKYTLKYINSILTAWKKNHVITVQDIVAFDAEFQKKRKKGLEKARGAPKGGQVCSLDAADNKKRAFIRTLYI